MIFMKNYKNAVKLMNQYNKNTFADVFFVKMFAFVKVFHYICSGNYKISVMEASDKFNQEYGYTEDGEFPQSKMSNDTLSLNHRYKKDDGTQVFFSTPLDPIFSEYPTNHGEHQPYGGSKTHGYAKRPFTNSKKHARVMQKSQIDYKNQ